MATRTHAELYYHFIWSTKMRKEVILPDWENRLYGYIRVKSEEINLQVIALNGVENHIHLLVRTKAEHTPAVIAHDIKGSSFHFVNRSLLLPERFSWQNGYGVFSVSPHEIKKVKRYIERQKEHHGRGTIVPEWEKTEEDGSDEAD